jgi:hypothetical protein
VGTMSRLSVPFSAVFLPLYQNMNEVELRWFDITPVGVRLD